MLFNSVHFLLFFPIVSFLYYLLPHKIRWVWLLVCSYYFYMCWNPQYALLLATSTVITFCSGILIDLADKQKNIHLKKIWVALSFMANLAILFFFKYFYFAVDNLNSLFAIFQFTPIQPQFDILLPVGISFYTFQALSYTVDVYRGDIYAEKNLAKYALFVSFFPQLVAGPIERSKNLLVQINEVHQFQYENLTRGLQLMLWGFFQKLVISDRAAILVNQVYNNAQDYAGLQIALATVLFAIQIYCDFGGYSNIAIGAAQIMGFRLMKNFNTPYFAISIKDFWRRWHISLSTWFRDYLYIPLGGSRCSKVRRYINLMITFLASGLWHGASWNYILWGALHGLYQIAGDILRPAREKAAFLLGTNRESFSYRLLQTGTTFILVNFAWIFFRAPGAKAALKMIKSMFSVWNPWIFFDGSLYSLGLDQKEFSILFISIIILFAVSCLQQKISIRAALAKQDLWFRWCIYYAALFAVLIFGIYGIGFDASQFIYFQF